MSAQAPPMGRQGERQAIDGRQLKALLRAYFIVSTRAIPIGVTGAKRMRTLPIILGIYTLLGLVAGLFAGLFPSVLLYAVMIHTITLFLVGAMALNEASEVLFNSRDGEIVSFRPVHNSTLVLAKGLTLVGFCLLIALAMNLGPCIFGGFADDARGWFGLVHLGSVVLETLFVCSAVVFLHGVIVRYLGAARFQRFVTAAQIASTMLLVVGFQILPRLAEKMDMSVFDGTWNPVWWLPPTWFASIDAALASKTGASGLVVPATAAVGVTVLLAWFGVVRLPRAIERSGNTEGRPIEAPVVRETSTPRAVRATAPRFEGALWRLWMRDPVERAIFRLCATQLARDRALKVRLAAGLSYFFVLPILFVLDSKKGPGLSFVAVWMGAMTPLTAVEFMRLSSVPDSAELFLFTPIAKPSALLHGTRKAALTFIVLPLVVYAIAVAAFAVRHQPELLWLALPPLFLVHPMSMVPGWRGEFIPFSQAQRTGERTAQVLAMFVGMIPLAVLGGLVALAKHLGWPVLGVLVVSAIAIGQHILLRAWVQTRSPKILRRE